MENKEKRTVIINEVEYLVAENKHQLFDDIICNGTGVWEVPKSYGTGDLTKLMSLGIAKNFGI